MELYKEVGQTMRLLRHQKRFTRKNVADYLGVTPATYTRYESGQSKIPLRIVKSLAIFYDTNMDYIVGLTNESAPLKRDESTD